MGDTNSRRLYRKLKGFTIVELLIVVVVIAILATIAIVAYNGLVKRAADSSIVTDGHNAKNGLGIYAVDHDDTYTPWYSDSTAPTDLNIAVSPGNKADLAVTSDKKNYCLRIYNPRSTYSSVATAYTIESAAGACQSTVASAAAGTGNSWKAVQAGYYSTCALGSNDLLYCWGNATYTGTNGTGNVSKPTQVYSGGALSGRTVKSFSLQGNRTCIVASDSKVYCWGDNTSGALGNGSTTSSSLPVAVDTSGVLSGKTMETVQTSAASYTCATDSAKILYCWGEDDNMQLGDSSLVNSWTPLKSSSFGLLDSTTATSYSVGNDHICLLVTGTAYCYGDNGSGQSGVPASNYTTGAINISNLSAFSSKTITQISAMGDDTCAITNDKKMYCWGYNADGQLGNGSTTTTNTPTQIDMSGALSGKGIISVTASYYATCVIATDGKPYCWGRGAQGQLGNNSTANSSVPVAVDTSGALSGVTLESISTTGYHVCALGTNKKLYCWGYNYYGQLGNGSTTNVSTPVEVSL